MMQILMQRFWRALVRPPMLVRAIVLLAAVLAYGTAGFLYFELPLNPDLTWQDSLWYCLVTMTTVGYGDFFPKSAGGRFLVGVPLMLFGIGLLGYVLSALATALITAKNKELKGMGTTEPSGHIVVIHYPGLPKMQRLMAELRLDPAIGKDTHFVLIDPDLDELHEALDHARVRFIRGDPAQDETLVRANVDEASHAIVLSRPQLQATDAINVAVTLAIEARTAKVNTVVECMQPATAELLKKAGCDRVVCSGKFEALYVSQELLNPGVQDVVADLLSNTEGQQIYLTPMTLKGAAAVEALTRATERAGHVLLGVQRAGVNHLRPAASFALEAGDKAITMGSTRESTFAVA